MTKRDERIEALRLEIIEVQRPLQDAWDKSRAEITSLTEVVSARVKTLRSQMNDLIKQREVDRACGAEKDEEPSV